MNYAYQLLATIILFGRHGKKLLGSNKRSLKFKYIRIRHFELHNKRVRPFLPTFFHAINKKFHPTRLYTFISSYSFIRHFDTFISLTLFVRFVKTNMLILAFLLIWKSTVIEYSSTANHAYLFWKNTNIYCSPKKLWNFPTNMHFSPKGQ